MSGGISLAGMQISFGIDFSSLSSNIAEIKADLGSVSDAASQATSVFKGLEGAANGSRIVSNVDVAEAQLTLLESKVTEAREKLQSLQNAADAGEAVTGIPEAEAQLTLLEAKAQEASQALQQLQDQETVTSDASMSLGERFSGAVGGIMNFGSQVGMTMNNLQMLGQVAQQSASALLDPAATAETTQLSFETLLHSTKAAHDEMVSLNTYAASTPMQTQWVDNAAAKILAFGGTTKDVIPEITAIGDSLSGLGKLSEPSLNSIVDIFGKISAQGKLTGGDMMQLSTWGIPAWQALSDAMGKPIPELQKMVSAGVIPADTAIKALETGMEKTFGGGMAKQANTFTGILSTLASNFQIAMAALGSPLLKLAETGLTNIGNILSSPGFQDFAANVGQKIADVFSRIAGFITSDVVPAFQDLMNYLNGDAFQGFIADVQTVGNQISRMLTPAFQALVPYIPSFRDALSEVGGIITGVVVPAIDAIVFPLGQFLMYLNENKLAMQIFEDLLIGVGAAFATIQIANFVAALPELLTGLGVWASEMAAIAIETLIAVGPVILIGAAIALLVAGIILAIQHWSDIVAWFQGVWQAFTTWFMGAMGAIGDFFVGIWNSIASFFVGVWQGLVGAAQSAGNAITSWWNGLWNGIVSFFTDIWNRLVSGATSGWNSVTRAIQSAITATVQWIQGAWNSTLQFFANLWQGITGGVQTGWNAIVGAIRTAIQSIVGFFSWLYNHNYYFQWLIDGIKAVFTAGLAWIQNAWSATVQWLAGLWNGIVTTAQSIWTGIVSIAQSVWGAITGWIQSAWSATSQWLADRWNGIVHTASSIWTGIVSIAQSVWNAITSAIQTAVQATWNWLVSAWTNVSSWLAGLWRGITNLASSIWSGITTFFVNLWNGTINWFVNLWTSASTWLQTQWNKLAGFAQTAWQNVSNVFANIWSTYIVGPLTSLWNSITGWFSNLGNQARQSGVNFINMLVDGINSGVGAIWNAVVNIAHTIWTALGFHSPPAGGPLADSDTYMPRFLDMLSTGLTAGVPKLQAAVHTVALPLTALAQQPSLAPLQAAVQASAGNTVIENHTHVYLDGEEMAHRVGNHMMRATRRRTGLKV